MLFVDFKRFCNVVLVLKKSEVVKTGKFEPIYEHVDNC